MRETSCDECGQSFIHPTKVGRLPARCPGCTAAYVAHLEKAKSERRAARNRGEIPPAGGVVRCFDCGLEMEWSGKGRPRERCDPCRAVHLRRTGAERSLKWIRENPELAKEKSRKGYIRNADKIRARSLADHYQRKYGITISDRDRMLDVQGGLCAICGGLPKGKGNRLHVDHCHTTNKIRGLLCSPCNTLLGQAQEDVSVLRSAIAYLEAHKT